MAEPNNIRTIRERRGMTLEELAALTPHPTKGTPVDQSTIQKLEKGVRKLNTGWLKVLAAALDVPQGDLIGIEAEAIPVRRVPLVGSIPAGNWREAIEDAIDLIPCTKGGPNTFALVAEGDSMDLVVSPGVTIFVDPDDRDLREGKRYAILRDSETTFKEVRLSPLRLVPCSSNKAHRPIIVGDDSFTTVGRVIGQQSDL